MANTLDIIVAQTLGFLGWYVRTYSRKSKTNDMTKDISIRMPQFCEVQHSFRGLLKSDAVSIMYDQYGLKHVD